MWIFNKFSRETLETFIFHKGNSEFLYQRFYSTWRQNYSIKTRFTVVCHIKIKTYIIRAVLYFANIINFYMNLPNFLLSSSSVIVFKLWGSTYNVHVSIHCHSVLNLRNLFNIHYVSLIVKSSSLNWQLNVHLVTCTIANKTMFLK